MTKHEAAREIVMQGNCAGVPCSECPLNILDCCIPNGKKANALDWLAANPEQKESLMPKYKIDPIPGLPAWFTPGIVCRVRDLLDEKWHNPRPIDTFIRDDELVARYNDNNEIAWVYAEPVEQWEPQEGEWVAAWHDNQSANTFTITKYYKACLWDHYARLSYPDGRVIDCACDVETIKTRTDWI